MRKIYLKMVLMFTVIALLTSGCVRNDVTIQFDNHDNMIVRTKLLYKEDISDYISLDELAPEKLKDSFAVKADKIQTNTTFEDMDIKDRLGHYQVETCKHVSHAKNIKKISIIQPQSGNNGILTVQNFIFFKKYIFKGKVVPSKELIEKVRNSKEFSSSQDPESFIDSDVVIEIPKQAKSINTNADMDDMGKGSKYYWIITDEKNLISMEFSLINWFGISSFILLICLIIYYTICKRLVFNWRKIVSNLSKNLQKFSETDFSTQKKEPLVRQNTNTTPISRKRTKTVFLIAIPLIFILLGSTFFLFSPKICEILIDNSIKSIYVGEIIKAERMIEFVNILNFDKNTDYSKEIFEKGLNEIENNDTKTAKVFFDLVTKIKTQNNQTYATELTDKALKALKQNQLNKCKILTKTATEFDNEIPKTLIRELSKKQYDLAFKKKYHESLIVSEILLMIDPKNPDNHFRYAASLALLGKDKQAISAYTESISLKRDFGSAYLNRGLIYAHKLSDEDKALKDFEQAINVCYAKNELAMAKLSISRIYMKRKNYNRAYVNACSAEETFFELGDEDRRIESMNICYTAGCKLGAYCGPLYY